MQKWKILRVRMPKSRLKSGRRCLEELSVKGLTCMLICLINCFLLMWQQQTCSGGASVFFRTFPFLASFFLLVKFDLCPTAASSFFCI